MPHLDLMHVLVILRLKNYKNSLLYKLRDTREKESL